MASSFFGPKVGWRSLAASSLLLFALAIAVAGNVLSFDIDLDNYLHSPLVWVVFAVLFAAIGALAVAIPGAIDNSLIGTVSSLRRQSEDLALALERAESANRAKNSFHANVSHEIQTPLNAIMGYSNLLKGDTSESDRNRYLGKIEFSGRKLVELVDSFLDLSRIESQDLVLNLQPTQLRAVISDLHETFRSRARKRGLLLEFIVDKNVPGDIELDGIRIRQVLGLLVDNALKFTQEGEVKVRVKTRQRGDRLDLEFMIKDTGIGIPANELTSIFLPFTQVEGQSVSEFSGTGSGLALADGLVRVMNGTLTVESKLGKGSIFLMIIENVKPAESSLSRHSDLPDKDPGNGVLGRDVINQDLEISDDPESPDVAVVPQFQSSSLITEEEMSAIKDLSGLIVAMEAEREKIYTIIGVFAINEIESTGNMMKRIGAHHACSSLELWCDELIDAAQNFDLDFVSNALQQYDSLVAIPIVSNKACSPSLSSTAEEKNSSTASTVSSTITGKAKAPRTSIFLASLTRGKFSSLVTPTIHAGAWLL